MASVKRQLAPVPVIPAIPRIFEPKRSAPAATKLSASASLELPKTPAPVEEGLEAESTTPTAAPEPTDWASLAAEEELVNTPVSSSGNGNERVVSSTPKAQVAVADLSNGAQGNHHPAQNHVNGYDGAPNAHGSSNHHPVMPPRVHQVPNYPPGLAPYPLHAAPHIAFGSFGDFAESEGSSPTLPPSATSTHFTQPTPLSDTHSQNSRGGPANGTHERGIPRPPFRVHHAHRPSHVSQPQHQRHGSVGVLLQPTVTFNDRNRDELLGLVGDDLFAGGANELNLTVTTQDGRDSFRIWRAICRRSPELSRLLDACPQSHAEATHATPAASAEINSTSVFVTPESVRSIIQSLYGAPLISAEVLDGRHFMSFRRPLELIATGYLLGAGLALGFGTELALKMMNWESLAANFPFVLESSQIDHGDGKGPDLVDLPVIVRVPRPHYVEILAQSLDCIIREINSDESFKFETHAAYFPELGGGFHARPVSVSLPDDNPTNGAAQIQFGNADGFYGRRHQTLSSILVSMPLVVLQHILSHVYNPAIVHDVVNEREKRRLFALNGGSTASYAHYQESIMPTPEFNGMRVVSTRVH